jgi:hypothetical protein
MFDLFIYESIYSKVTRIIQIIAKINEPRAKDPTLYQEAQTNPVPMEKAPLES